MKFFRQFKRVGEKRKESTGSVLQAKKRKSTNGRASTATLYLVQDVQEKKVIRVPEAPRKLHIIFMPRTVRKISAMSREEVIAHCRSVKQLQGRASWL